MNIAGIGLIGMTENRNQQKQVKKRDRILQSMLQNKYNLCVCTIYSYHIMHNIVIHTVKSNIYDENLKKKKY